MWQFYTQNMQFYAQAALFIEFFVKNMHKELYL